ncbi:Stk1 family PASTA domain-containing Ser/Thr kinase [Chengkuizengella axinellae]|uniref:non-specific serine/threonine protein kinase n=1 Tax=Chengkuizengella axinellae TaxID=3064388 RepID=A0ABT9IVH5_9BACL|nr:Stk1 family PASTA domain-containing Ser/Thr kinase [Chengkuizengella sp. 2205SS18-9]MDP5273369.1 Stk1 family PASTA domain-containing Ser/Thr kinase [Chengkuizengella sp. 2205SS18-9]
MIGQQLSGRYEILNRVGGGGMALVFKAHDKLLNRMVAIKVLRQQFVYDEDFIRRFRREAQSAASLSHPNVVNIYDVGQEEDIHYIVMEYIEGSNLNEEIKRRAPFQVDEAIHIACQICDALEHAHQNQIIHRDIKPHNILIGKNGRVKVTDFGIARAATSSEITQTGSVLGSVHYFSPEHAKGVTQGAKSDLYSLGIVLYQMLTNKLPFSGESPISIALKHIQEDVEEPRKLNSLIPQSVENVVLKSMQKNPEQRYQSAKEMLLDLETSLSPEKMNEQKFSFDDNLDDDEQTKVMPVIGLNRKVGQMDIDNTIMPELKENNDKKNRFIWVKPVVWTFSTIIILFSAWFGVKAVLGMLDVPDVEVPDVIGLTLEDATIELEENQLIVKEPVQYKYDNEIEAGIVIEQSDISKKVKANYPITLTVSNGQEEVIMENYVGMQWVDVENDLRKKGFADGKIEMEMVLYDAPVGEVIEQTPSPDEKYSPNDQDVIFSFKVSEGLGSIEMPDLIGVSKDAAISMLQQRGLNYIIEYDFYINVPKGFVFRQRPIDAGSPVNIGQEITISVSEGDPDNVRKPKQAIIVAPETEGEESTIEIKITDAIGTDRVWKVEKIVEEETYYVPVVLMPDLEGGKATISVTVDYKHVGTYDVKYEDYE